MKSRQSNLHFFFLFLLTLIGFSSCSEGTDINDIVPDTHVDFTYHDNENKLGAENNSIYLGEDDIITSSAGYKNHGIILVLLFMLLFHTILKRKLRIIEFDLTI